MKLSYRKMNHWNSKHNDNKKEQKIVIAEKYEVESNRVWKIICSALYQNFVSI